MNKDLKSGMPTVLRNTLRPLVRMLLNAGMPWKEFADISKSVYVDVAGSDYGIQGRPTNASRVSILTGLTRREVKAQRDKLESTNYEGSAKLTAAARVLSAWHQNPKYQNAERLPAEIPIEGPEPSFEALHREHAGDVPLTALLKELQTTNCIGESPDGLLVAERRYYMPAQLDDQAVERAGSVWRDIGDTLVHNLRRENESDAIFEGRASNHRMPAAMATDFRRYLEKAAQAFLEDADNWLSEKESPDHQQDPIRLGVGVYTIIDQTRTGS